MKNYILPFLLTISILGVALYYLMGSPDIGIKMPDWKLPDWKFEMPDWKSDDSSTKKKKNKKSYKASPPATASVVDEFNGVKVYYNGQVGNVYGRNTTADGYNLGLRYQCVEFAKRYYYEYFDHKMPNSYGHAKDFFDRSLNDGAYNKARDLKQYKNNGRHKPKKNDLLVYGATPYNGFGHLAIITNVNQNSIGIIQQNPGLGNPTRETIPMSTSNGRFKIEYQYILGWLRK